MRFRTHAIASALAGIALYPRRPRRAALVLLAGTLVDLDHYLLYALRSGDWNPLGAMRYNQRRKRIPRPGDTRPRYGALRSQIHRPHLTLPVLALLSRAWPWLWPVTQGVALHLAMDTSAMMEWDWRVWRRAGARCERCGIIGLQRAVHHVRPPRSRKEFWALDNRIVVCMVCSREQRRALGMVAQ